MKRLHFHSFRQLHFFVTALHPHIPVMEKLLFDVPSGRIQQEEFNRIGQTVILGAEPFRTLEPPRGTRQNIHRDGNGASEDH